MIDGKSATEGGKGGTQTSGDTGSSYGSFWSGGSSKTTNAADMEQLKVLEAAVVRAIYLVVAIAFRLK